MFLMTGLEFILGARAFTPACARPDAITRGPPHRRPGGGRRREPREPVSRGRDHLRPQLRRGPARRLRRARLVARRRRGRAPLPADRRRPPLAHVVAPPGHGRRLRRRDLRARRPAASRATPSPRFPAPARPAAPDRPATPPPRPGDSHGTHQAHRSQVLRLRARRRRRRRARAHRDLRQPARAPPAGRRRADRRRVAAGAAPADAGRARRRGRRAHQPPDRRRRRVRRGPGADAAVHPRAAPLLAARPGLPPVGQRDGRRRDAVPDRRGAVGRHLGHRALRAGSRPGRPTSPGGCPATSARI